MKKGNEIFYNMLLLTGTNFLLRLAGMSFQVYLSGRIGAAGIGLLQLVLSVAALAFTVGSAGVRTCATYLSAGEIGRGQAGGLSGVLSGCCQYSLLFGGAAAIALWRAAPWLCEVWIGDRAAIAALRLFALFLPVRCLHGVMTGYFTAAKRVGSTVVVSFLEQGCSIAVTLALLSRWAGADSGRAAVAVVAGGCAADVLGFLLLVGLRAGTGPRERARPPYSRILRVALPLALADTLRSGLNTIEDLIIPRQLALFAGTVNAMADYGMIRGMVFPVLMFPAAILFSLAELLVPEFSRCAARGSKNRVQYLAKQGLRVSMLFGLCAGGMLFAMADALGELLYREQQVGDLLRLYALFVPMLYVDTLVDAMCKGLGQQNANARYNTLTSFLDVVFLWCLLPKWGLNGYTVSFAVTHLINFVLSLRRLIRVSGIRPAAGRPALAVICTAAAGGVAALADGVLLAGGSFLLLLGGLWYLCGIIGRDDFLWMRKLIGGRYGR
ncbi:MAG: polysaccharide biosynthesis C-terminal domain-containing protein [Oscillospiraceae bacterium]|nr:polysaccharide biosynthesis C-terminal domain-containing protein [Oscillospiraceae bacterium]